MPRPARWWVGMPANRTLSNSSLPVAGVKPMIVRSRVVLPAPLRPMSPANSPASTSRSTSRRMATGPMDTDTPSSRSMRRLLANDIAAHVLHAEHSLRRTIANDAAVVEGHHAAGKARDDIHVVLDENHPHAGIPRGTHYHVHDSELLVCRDAAGRLVQQQQLRAAGERHGDIEQLADTFGQRSGHSRRIRLELEPCQRRVGRRSRIARCGDALGYQQIVAHTQRLEELRYLERARDSQLRDLPWIEPHDVAPAEYDASAVRLKIAGHHVEECRLAGAVGPDEADNGVHVER